MATIANTVTKETVIKIATTDTSNITRDYSLPGFSRKTLIPNPSLNNSGTFNLCTTNTNWQQLTPEFNATFAEINSDSLMYIKIEKNTLGYQVLQSKTFSYDNPEIPIKISVCNGTLDYDSGLDLFTTNNDSKDISAYFVILKHSNVC